ncbi:MAG: DsrE family protein [Oligoflexales bacterium]|nr:DsrE family protein [Oligoflexales bacterium]
MALDKKKQIFTFVLMDPPFESARTTTAMRLIHAAVCNGLDVKVFAYEGAVFLPLASQKAHANSIHGRGPEEENHPLTKDWVSSLAEEAVRRGGSMEWVNCGLCVDERGAQDVVPAVRRGSPLDLLQFSEISDQVLVIPTR